VKPRPGAPAHRDWQPPLRVNPVAPQARLPAARPGYIAIMMI
jgi:hypothetical protein